MPHDSPSQDESERSSESTKLGRRAFIASSVATTALAGCVGGGDDGTTGDTTDNTETTEESEPSFEGETLRVMVWSGTYKTKFKNTVAKMYEEETGANIKVLGGWGTILSEIRASPADKPPFDVTVLTGQDFNRAINGDLIQKLRYENIPNADNIYPYLMEFRNTTYGVPIDGGPMAIIYTDDLGWEPTSFKDFTSEQAQSANIAMEGSGFEYPIHLGAIAADELEGTKEVYDDAKREAAWTALEEFDINSWYSGGAKFWQQLRNDVADLGQWYTGSGWAKVQENDSWNMYFPDESVAYYDTYSVVRGTDKRRMAEHFLDFLASSEVQTAWAKENPNIMSNKDTTYPEPFNEWYPQTNEAYSKIATFDWKYLMPKAEQLTERFKQFKAST